MCEKSTTSNGSIRSIDAIKERIRFRIFVAQETAAKKIKSGCSISDLTETERLAICIAAGIETHFVSDKVGIVNLRTVRPCAIQIVNGRIHIAERKG